MILNVVGKRNDNNEAETSEATVFLIDHHPDTRVKLSLVKFNIFIYRPHREKEKKATVREN